ncbi:MAG: cache domain-containing protein [Anaerolineae bacterium]
MTRHGETLRTKIIAWSFVPTAIVLAAVALVNYFAYQQVTEDLVIQRDRELTRLSASQMSSELGQYAQPLDLLARSPDLFQGDAAAQQDALSQARNELVVYDGGVVVLDTFGHITATHPERADILGQDWSDRSYYRALLHSDGPAYSDIVMDGADGESVIVVAVPIKGLRGEAVGILAGMFRLGAREVSAFYGSIVKLRLGESGTAVLVDSSGRVIYDSTGEHTGESMASQAVVREVLSGKGGNTRTRDLQGNQIVASYAPVPGTGWGLVIQERWGDLMLSSYGYRQWLLGLLALGVALPALVVLVGVGRITRPISQMIDAAQGIAGGNFGLKIEAHTGDELEELAAQFNRMSDQLQESYATLERRVADRTRELAALNAIAEVVSRSLDLGEILSSALEETIQVTSMDIGRAYRLNERRGELELVAQHGIEHDSPTLVHAFLPKRPSEELSSGDGRPVLTRVESLPEGDVRTELEARGVVLVVHVPFVIKGRLTGAMMLASRSERALSQEEIALLDGIGRQIGMAVENARLYECAEESAVAAERSRLARDLHDAVTQTLFSASLIAEVLPRLWDRNEEMGRQRLEDLRQLTRGALAEMRSLLVELRPAALAEARLDDLMRQLGESITGRARIPVSLTVQGQCDLTPDVKVALYRIAQEALNNVAKHSGAKHVSVSLACSEGHVQLAICDDGNGFDLASVPPDHLGLGIMRERAQGIGASIGIESAPDSGTAVRVEWRGQGVGK